MAARTGPLVALLSECRVRYRGRATAVQRGGRLLIVVKEDGAVSVHSLKAGVKPHFYNPAGVVRVQRKGSLLTVEARSDSGEVLRVSGRAEFVHDVGPVELVPTARRRHVAGVERDLVSWIAASPRVVGLPSAKGVREVRRVGGRVDLMFGETVVEVKKTGDVTTYDQALRYLRDPGVERVKVACLKATANLRALCQGDRRVELVELNEQGFRRFVARG